MCVNIASSEYSKKFRNLQYLEGRLDEERSKEQERVQLAEKKLRKIQRKLKDEVVVSQIVPLAEII